MIRQFYLQLKRWYKITSKKELLLRTLGALEYLQQVGVKLPEPEEAKMTEETAETPEIEGEVVNGEGDLPEPETEGWQII